MAASTAEYGAISRKKTKIMNSNIEIKLEPFYCGGKIIILALHNEQITSQRRRERGAQKKMK